MKNTIKIVSLVSILLISVLLLTGCENGSKSNSIVGSWKYNSGNYTYTFNEDGTGDYDTGGSKMEFTYTLEDGKISILYKGSTSPFTSEYTIEGDTLNIVDSFGNNTLYTRVK